MNNFIVDHNISGCGSIDIIPLSEKFERTQFSTTRFLTAITRIPFGPNVVPVPFMEKLRIVTNPPGALTMMPFVPLDSIEPMIPPPSIVIDLVMVTVPNPHASRILISPPVAVLLMALANVLQGTVRLQGFASSPTPEIQVLVD